MAVSKKIPAKDAKEKVSDLKKDTVKKSAVKKGYNEQNPVQPHGAFKPDNSK